MSLPAPWREALPRTDRVLAPNETPPAHPPNATRIIIDVRRDAMGRITVHWGLDDRTIGNPAVQVQYSGKVAEVVTTGSLTTLDLPYKVTHDNGVVTVIGPGTEP